MNSKIKIKKSQKIKFLYLSKKMNSQKIQEIKSKIQMKKQIKQIQNQKKIQKN